MKRFFHISFLALVLTIGATVLSPVAHAQFDSSPNNDAALTQNAPTAAENAQAASAGVVAPPSLTPAQYAANAAAAGTPTTYGAADKDSPYNFVMIKIMELFAWLLGVAALTLNYAVFYTVIKMGSFINNLSAVGVTWQILRDLGNILLIFGFLAIGISTIVNVDIYGWGKKMLPMLLVAAIFLNFSLFISEAVIDTGNLFATQFYQQIVGGTLPTQGSSGTLVTSSGATLTTANEGISTAIMNKLGLQTIYGDGKVNQDIFLKNNPWLVGFMGIILFLVAAFVMFSLAFILISRFVILLYLIILSPVGFAGLAVPKLESSAKKWWAGLFEQSITAPLLLLTLYIALRVITDVNFLTGFGMAANSSGASTGFVNNLNLPGFASFILSFLVAMGLLLAVVIFSKKLSAFGAGWASKTAGAVTFGATAFVGRRTVGRVSNYTARAIRSSSLGRTETGRLLAGVADRGAKASFDARGATVFGGLKATGIDAGEAGKGGYQGREKELIEARTQYAKGIKQSSAQKSVVDAAQAEHDKNMLPLQEAEQMQLRNTKSVIDKSREALKIKRQELEVARKSGNQDRIKTAEAAYNNDLQTHNELKEAEKEKLDPIREKIDAEKKRLEAATAKNSATANQRKYAEALQEKSFLGVPRAPYDWTTAVGSARREAADKIMGDTKKDKNQKNLEKLEEILAKADKKSDSGGEDKH